MRVNSPAGTRSGLMHDLKGVASLTLLLGLTWTVGFFTFGPARVVLLYLFSGLNTLQGFFIFLFHCLMKENVRKQWRIHLCFGRFRLEEHSGMTAMSHHLLACKFNSKSGFTLVCTGNSGLDFCYLCFVVVVQSGATQSQQEFPAPQKAHRLPPIPARETRPARDQTWVREQSTVNPKHHTSLQNL
uniref:Adhesion G protein-coupled receptor G4b n=1 Tax=Lates calcarifer TaxID=8187 RepID=A0A4W6EY35_LATCA